MGTRRSVSVAATAAGLPFRYVYWHGHSGRRYLFTAADRAAITDFDEGVAILASAGTIVWAGEIAALARMPQIPGALDVGIFVHLLAATARERRAAIADLHPEAGAQLRSAA